MSSIAFVSGLAGLGAVGRVLKCRVKGKAGSERWIIAELILTIPVVAMLVLFLPEVFLLF
jgi:hypothetical protein